MSQSPGISGVTTPTCKMGAASGGDKTLCTVTAIHRYPAEDYAIPVISNAEESAVTKNVEQQAAAPPQMQEVICQYTYDEGQTSANEATIW